MHKRPFLMRIYADYIRICDRLKFVKIFMETLLTCLVPRNGFADQVRM